MDFPTLSVFWCLLMFRSGATSNPGWEILEENMGKFVTGWVIL